MVGRDTGLVEGGRSRAGVTSWSGDDEGVTSLLSEDVDADDEG